MGKIKIDLFKNLVIYFFKNLVIYFYLNEGKRPHVHIAFKGRDIMQIWLDDLSIKKTYTRNKVLQREILGLIADNKNKYLEEWRKTHDK